MNDVTLPCGTVALAASVYGPAEAPPVLLLHGLGNARDVWFHWAMRLADRYRVLALDFRGHGHSARAPRYALTDFVADAEAALAWLGRPTCVVGHSLGGTVAGALSVAGHPLAARALLVDPAWYFAEPEEFARTVYPKRFAMLQGAVERLRAADTPLAAWMEMIANTPHPRGGTFADVLPQHQVVSHASALQRQDPACWSATPSEMFGGIDVDAPFRVPTTVIQADSALGAALLDHQAERMQQHNRPAALWHYMGSDHFPHRTTTFADRFGADLERFLLG
jgi:pimeloyl-ACP methyl ester carboxylesterase